jgi:hypothetical protein
MIVACYARDMRLTVAPLFVLVACGGSDFSPPAEVCGPAGAHTATGLEIGHAGDDAWVPLTAGQPVDIEIGAGAQPYLGVRLRVTGPGQDCLDQQTELLSQSGGLLLAGDATPAPTYGDGAARSTHTLWIPVVTPPVSGSPVRLRVMAGGQLQELMVVAP